MFLLLIDSILTQLWPYLLLLWSTDSVVYTSLFAHPDFRCFRTWYNQLYSVSNIQVW